jgi:hypothetical protein
MVIGVNLLQHPIYSLTWKLTKGGQRTPIFEERTIMHSIMMVWLGWSVGKEALNSTLIMKEMLSIGISFNIGGFECSNNICCSHKVIEAKEVFFMESCCSCDVSEFRDDEGKDTCKERKKFLSFELAMAWFTQIDWWSLYPCWKRAVLNAIHYCLQLRLRKAKRQSVNENIVTIVIIIIIIIKCIRMALCRCGC